MSECVAELYDWRFFGGRRGRLRDECCTALRPASRRRRSRGCKLVRPRLRTQSASCSREDSGVTDRRCRLFYTACEWSSMRDSRKSKSDVGHRHHTASGQASLVKPSRRPPQRTYKPLGFLDSFHPHSYQSHRCTRWWVS